MEKYTHILIDNQVSWHPQCWRNICINASWGRWRKNSQNNHFLAVYKKQDCLSNRRRDFRSCKSPMRALFRSTKLVGTKKFDLYLVARCYIKYNYVLSLHNEWKKLLRGSPDLRNLSWLTFEIADEAWRKSKSRGKCTNDSNFRLLIIVTKFWRFVWTSCHIL